MSHHRPIPVHPLAPWCRIGKSLDATPTGYLNCGKQSTPRECRAAEPLFRLRPRQAGRFWGSRFFWLTGYAPVPFRPLLATLGYRRTSLGRSTLKSCLRSRGKLPISMSGRADISAGRGECLAGPKFNAYTVYQEFLSCHTRAGVGTLCGTVSCGERQSFYPAQEPPIRLRLCSICYGLRGLER
jgi:hypothetical protein